MKENENGQNNDQSGKINGHNGRTRYSDSELEEFRIIIQGKLDKTEKDLKALIEAVRGNQNDTKDTGHSFKILEEASSVNLKEENAKLASRLEKFIDDLKNALIRIENKTYGICRVTGKLISKERLRIVPHATLSIEAKKEFEKTNKKPKPQAMTWGK